MYDNIVLTPQLKKKIEDELEKLNTPAAKKRLAKRLAPYVGNCFQLLNFPGVGWVPKWS